MPRSGLLVGLSEQPALELCRRQVTERRVQALLVVDLFEKRGDAGAGLRQALLGRRHDEARRRWLRWWRGRCSWRRSGRRRLGLDPAALVPRLTVGLLARDGGRLRQVPVLVRDFVTNVSLMFLAAGTIGLDTYLLTLANTLHWAKRFISNQMMKKVNYALGVVLVLLSFYFLGTSIKVLVHL